MTQATPNPEPRQTVILGVANLDAAMAPGLRARLTPLVARGVALTIDLSAVRFIDSGGLGVLLALADRGRPGALRFSGVSPSLGRALGRAPGLNACWMADDSRRERSA